MKCPPTKMRTLCIMYDQLQLYENYERTHHQEPDKAPSEDGHTEEDVRGDVERVPRDVGHEES